MKLITENAEDLTVELLEDNNGQKKCFIEGIFLQAGVKNRNGRIYPPSIMEAEVNRYIKDNVDAHRAFGELGHPTNPSVNLDRVSHIITSLRRDGNNYVGKALVTEGTPSGKIVVGLLAAGAKLGVSSRGLGSLKPNSEGINEVQSDFKLVTAADIVANPSAPDAYVNGLYEGAEWIWDNGILVERELEQARRAIDNAARSANAAKLQESKLNAWGNLLRKLSR